MRLESRAQAIAYRDQCLENIAQETCRILICGGTGCLAGGAGVLYQKFMKLVEGTDTRVQIGAEIAHLGVHKSGCHGFCEMGPLVRIEPYHFLYLKVQPEDCEEIFRETVMGGRPVERPTAAPTTGIPCLERIP